MQQVWKTQAIIAVSSLKHSLQFVLVLRMLLVSLIRTDTFPEMSSCEKRSVFPRKLQGLRGIMDVTREIAIFNYNSTFSLKILCVFRGATQEVTCHCFFHKYCFTAHMSSASLTAFSKSSNYCPHDSGISSQDNKQDNWKAFLCICAVLWLMQLGTSRDQITD